MQLQDYALEVSVESVKAWAFRFMAHIMMNFDGDGLNEAEHWIKNAIEVDKKIA